MLSQVVLLDEQHLLTAASGIARDRRAVDAAADDEQVERFHLRSLTLSFILSEVEGRRADSELAPLDFAQDEWLGLIHAR